MRRIVLAGCLAALCTAAVTGPASSAWASDASIKAAVRSFDTKIVASEEKAAGAIREYRSTGDPKPVQTALSEAISVLRALKAKIAGQSAKTSRVKAGKAELLKGLRDVIRSYQHLSTAFGVKSLSPSAAKAQAEKALTELKTAKALLRKAGRLLR